MKRTDVISSNLASIGWKNDVLEVEFKNGSVYSYGGVKEVTFKQLMSAKSKGKYFNQYIIKGGYKFKKK